MCGKDKTKNCRQRVWENQGLPEEPTAPPAGSLPSQGAEEGQEVLADGRWAKMHNSEWSGAGWGREAQAMWRAGPPCTLDNEDINHYLMGSCHPETPKVPPRSALQG